MVFKTYAPSGEKKKKTKGKTSATMKQRVHAHEHTQTRALTTTNASNVYEEYTYLPVSNVVAHTRSAFGGVVNNSEYVHKYAETV